MVKLTGRCFCRFTAAMLVPLGRAPTWRFHTKLYKFGWSTFPNNARMKNRTELNLGKVFYVWLIYHIQGSWLNSLNGYDIYFWLRDTANQPYWVNEPTKLGFIREFKQITTAGADTAAGSKFSQKWDTAHARRLHPAVAWNLTTWVGMFCGSGWYVRFISLFWPFSTDISAFYQFHWILYPLKSV